jgi:GTP:adenosylcobinamide-phosphate guanylyltransferase
VAQLYHAVVLAAGRGPNDPMAKAYGVSHKCILPVAGIPMLKRVINTLRQSKSIAGISVSIESREIVDTLFRSGTGNLKVIQSENSAPLSAIAAIAASSAYPVLITTADHALLTTEMVEYFCAEAAANGADFSAGLARAEVIQSAYPQSSRTYFKLGADRVSGCNLFAVQNENGLRLLERWRYLEVVRKKPWRLIAAFGPMALIRFAFGKLSLDQACRLMSQRLGMTIRPVLMPFAEAAIDVDKPSDLVLAEEILERRNAGN